MKRDGLRAPESVQAGTTDTEEETKLMARENKKKGVAIPEKRGSSPLRVTEFARRRRLPRRPLERGFPRVSWATTIASATRGRCRWQGASDG